MSPKTWAVVVTAVTCAAPVQAWEFRCRFVERIGNGNLVLPGNVIDASNRAPRNIRVQFGVFDDGGEPAPAGGFVGWNVGTIAVSGPDGNSDERRNPGRLLPFNFAPGNSNGNPPPPMGFPSVPDVPWTILTQIDNTVGFQTYDWNCNPDGSTPPLPPAILYGLNTYVSTYAFSIDPINDASALDYTVTVAGNLIAASEWRFQALSPFCGDPNDPSDDLPGSVTYVPFPVLPRAFSCTLSVVVVPAVGSGATVIFGMTVMLVRHRRKP